MPASMRSAHDILKAQASLKMGRNSTTRITALVEDSSQPFMIGRRLYCPDTVYRVLSVFFLLKTGYQPWLHVMRNAEVGMLRKGI